MSETPERQIASDFVYTVSAWDGRSPEFMQCQVGKLASLIEDETLKLRTELAAARAANQRLEKERDTWRQKHADALIRPDPVIEESERVSAQFQEMECEAIEIKDEDASR